MKTVKFAFNTLLVVATMSLVFTSCKKKEKEDSDTDSAANNAFAEATYNDISTIADQASTGSTSSYRTSEDGSLLSACATITFDTANQSNVDTMTIDFGTTNCLCADGRNRRGKIIVAYTGYQFPVHYRDSAMSATITTSNYFVNDYQILGTKTVVNNGWNSLHHLTWTIAVNGTIVIPASAGGGTITWNCSKVKELLAGQASHGAPITWATAKVGITGNASGVSADNVSFTANVTTQLVRDFSCAPGSRRHFVSGNLDFQPGNKPIRHIDFGSGTCDDIAVVTIGTHTYTVHMH